MAARVQLPPVQDRTGRYRSGITVIGVTDADTEDAVAVYDAREGGSVITFPSPGVTSGDEGELEAWTAANTVSIEFDTADDSYDNPKIAELNSWDAIDEAITNIPFTEISGVPGVNVMEAPYNAAGDGSTDDWAAIQQAIEDASDDDSWRGWRVVLPPGTYRISQPIVINRRGTHLLGTGSARNLSGSTTILADGGQKGIIVKHPTGIGGSLGQFTNDPSDTSRGDASVLENFAIGTADNTVGTSEAIHGIDVKNNCTIRNVSVGGSGGWPNGFNGNGINFNAGVSTGNASQSVLVGGRCEGNLKHGIETAGGDTSAILFMGWACDLNGKWGFKESSFLGNTYLCCHTRDNDQLEVDGGGYWSDAPSLFAGCYTESGQGNYIQGPSIILRHAGVAGNDGGAPQLSGAAGDSTLYFLSGGLRIENSDSSDWIEIGESDTEMFYLGQGEGTGKALRLIWEDTNKEWAWPIGTAGGIGSAGAMALTGADSPRGAGYVRAATGFTIGTASTAVSVTRGAAAPVAGTWKRGDVVYHSSPSAGGNAGWICVTAGTPGTWKTFGTIES